MTTKLYSPEMTKDLHVVIIGAGIVGLTLAQGCKENGIPFTIFERDEKGSRPQGWALTLHWCLRSLERTIGTDLTSKLNTTLVDHTVNHEESGFPLLNAATGEIHQKGILVKQRIRAQREKFRDLLATGIDIQYGKSLQTIEEVEGDSIRAHFEDGTTATGTILVGADGSNSVVRKCVLGSQDGALTTLPIILTAVVRHFTAEETAPLRAIDPLAFRSLDPNTGNFLWFGTQDGAEEVPGKYSFNAVVAISYIVKDEVKDAIPSTNHARIEGMKARAAGFAEPLRSVVMDIDENSSSQARPMRLADFPSVTWDHKSGRVALAGDAAHSMTMYRGEGANHGILDAALLVDQLKKVRAGEIAQQEALDTYEAELVPRGHAAVLFSRQAAFDAHNWEALTLDSPFMNTRTAPDNA